MRIIYKKKFEKKFQPLSEKIKQRFYQRLAIFIDDEFHKVLHNHSVDKAYPGCRSINVTGDYRVIFKEEKDLVIFLKIGTHSDLY